MVNIGHLGCRIIDVEFCTFKWRILDIFDDEF